MSPTKKTAKQSNVDSQFDKSYDGHAKFSTPISKTNSDEKMSQNNQQQHHHPKQTLINVPLIPLKILLFTWYAAGACLLPYMTLHMKQLGLTMLETTMVYAILPIIQLFGTPIAGFVADRTGNYKSVLMGTLSICIFTTVLLQYMVPARKMRHRSDNVVMDPDESFEWPDMLTFWLYLVIRVIHQLSVGLSYVLLDTTAIVKSEEHHSNYGRQRFWAIMATGIFSPICGIIIDYMGYTLNEYDEKVNNYGPAFHFFNAFTILTLINVFMMNIEVSELPKNVWKNVSQLLKSANVWMFLFSVFIMGSCWGFLESFLFIHLQKLNAPNYLFGLTVTVGAFVGLPFLYGSEWFVNKFGAVQLLIVALVVYFIRLMGYSYLQDPWWCLPYELMEAFTLHLMWVSTVRLAYDISPPGMLASMQAVVGGLNFGVGRGFGSLVGGSVIVMHGIRTAFRVIGCMALITAIIYLLLHKFVLRDLSHFKDEQVISKNRRQTSKDVEASCQETETASAS